MNEGSPDLGAMVSKLLANPELLSEIASTVGVDMTPSEDKSAPSEGEAKPTSAPPNMDGILSIIGGMGGGKGTGGGAGRRSGGRGCSHHRSRCRRRAGRNLRK